MEKPGIKTAYVITLAVIAFLLHVVWENSQAPLFAGYSSLGQHFPMCLWATIGDVVFTLSVYFGISLLKNDFGWIMRLNGRDIAVITVIGFFWAIGIEWRALLFGKWNYADAMPIVPYLRVGLAPVLQMTLLLPLSFYLAKSAKIFAQN